MAHVVSDVTGFKGKLAFDTSKPDGTMRKLMNVSRLADMGWQAKIELKDGLQETYDWFLKQETVRS